MFIFIRNRNFNFKNLAQEGYVLMIYAKFGLVIAIVFGLFAALLAGIYMGYSDIGGYKKIYLSFYFGFGSALCWGISVIGILSIWNLGPVFQSPLWNGWFNFIAAMFAAVAAGVQAPQLSWISDIF